MNYDDAELLALMFENADLSTCPMSANRLVAALWSCRLAGHLDSDFFITADFREIIGNVRPTYPTGTKLSKIIWEEFR